MKTRKNVKGFTLVELIVVIAIIGVLAAILVPSMLGYVKKANQSAVNSNAKTIYNAAATAVTDCDTAGATVFSAANKVTGKLTIAVAAAGTPSCSDATTTFVDSFKQAVGESTLKGLTDVELGIVKNACTAAICKKGNYMGAYPEAVQNGGSASIDGTTGALTVTS
ncbi:MAG: type II secretion system protein [Oscillospiraceae bacterium]|nr:type II secretion system protein [Oscillospiraceae bacterium]